MARTEALSELGSGGQTPRGPSHVNAPVPFMLHAIVPRLPEFRSRYPEIDLRYDMIDEVIDLISAHVDVAIRFGPLEDSDLLKRHLGRTLWQLVAAPHYPDAHGWPKNLVELSSLEQVRFPAPAHISLLTFSEVKTSVDVPTAVEASNGEAVRRLVLAGIGIAKFSDFMVAEDLATGRLVELFPGEVTAEPLDISALYLTRASGLRRLAAFLD